MDDNLYFNITPNGDDKEFVLQNPHSLTCKTNVGPIRLTLDRDKPIFLFVEIDGEFRRCYDLRKYQLQFQTEDEVEQFLKKIRDSDFFNTIVEEELDMNQEWEDL